MPNLTDYFGINRKTGKRFTAEIKHVEDLDKNNIEQAASQFPRFPNEKLVIIPKNTNVPNGVKEYAKKKGVEIVRLKKDYH